MQIRVARIDDRDAVVTLRSTLWPRVSPDQHRIEVEATLSGCPCSTLPVAIMVAEEKGVAIGFIEIGLRSHADGCDPSKPCGFIEGWYVTPEHRGQGVGRALVARAEAWAAEHGCVELASDTWIDSEDSQAAHSALGFEVVDRCVNYRKSLRPDDDPK